MIIANIAIGYGVVAALVLVTATMAYVSVDRQSERRDTARIIILAPAWPVMLALFLWAFLAELWDDAEWGKS